MISLDESLRFDRLRQRVMRAVEYELKMNDGYCKSYEGAFEVTMSFPEYFQDETGTKPPDFVSITLHCYVLGPSRHYTWKGPTFLDALRKAEAEIDSWIEAQEEEKNNGIC